MQNTRFKLPACLLLICAWLTGLLPAQQKQAPSGEGITYGSEFFGQLHSIFGRFRDADLQRVFQEAQPIDCSELVDRKGQWRTVAFFNENRELGDWCRESLEEVKADLAAYTFQGDCIRDRGAVQVATEFPTTASIEAYNRSEIDLNQIDVTVNDPVRAAPNPGTMAYTFELPYLFLTGRRGSINVYSLTAPDRDAVYATDVTSRWECKSVSSRDAAYRFLICRTATVPLGSAARHQKWEPSFGASAFFILSDGIEAKASVNLKFSDETEATGKPEEPVPSPGAPARPSLKRTQKPNPPDEPFRSLLDPNA